MAREQAIYNHTLISLRAWEEYLKNYAGAAPLCLVSSDRSLFSLHAANFFFAGNSEILLCINLEGHRKRLADLILRIGG